MPKKNDEKDSNRTSVNKNRAPHGMPNTDLPEKFEKLSIEEKIPFLIAKCIQSMKDYEDRSYGKNRVCDILKGSYNKFVLENGHHHNPCFGVLRDFSRKNVSDFIDAMTERSILRWSGGLFPTLDVTGIGKELIRFRKQVRLEMPFDLRPTLIPVFDQNLYEHLHNVRLVQAKDEGVPPYCVIPNRCIVELCIKRPGDQDTLGGIHGFGPARVQRYGEMFLGAIAEFMV